jgi:phenylpropionate dioxygenase-like ring-hydroxylating dioxygenase large terminal subunit
MVPDQWYAVLEAREVPSAKPVGVTRLGEKLVLWRDRAGRVVCQRDRCAHRGAAISAGQVSGDRVRCPFHGFEYDASGRCSLIPANGRNTPVPERFRLLTYPAREAHGFIYVWWGEDQPELPPLPFFDDIDERFSFRTVRDLWHTHYSRAIENQLDVMHLPFVHRNTIGRGGRTLVDGPMVKWISDDEMHVFVYNRRDDGQPPHRPDELREPDGPFRLEFRFPNLWQNHLGEDTRIVVAFVPIDDEHTMLYLRFYQKSVRIPVIRDLVNGLAMPFNLLIARQDRRVVTTQRPKASGAGVGEQLVQGDRPIVEYRRRRRELKRRAGQ